jgi:hypothetical protein
MLKIFRRIKRRLNVPFALEIMVLMAWSIWTTRNDRIFNYIQQYKIAKEISAMNLSFSSTE